VAEKPPQRSLGQKNIKTKAENNKYREKLTWRKTELEKKDADKNASRRD